MTLPNQKLSKYLFHQQPFLVYWELTRSCDLACKHCRAEAQLHRNPLELQGDECIKLLEDIRNFGPGTQLVITGGDPLKHPDMFRLLERAKEIGQKVAVSPSGTTSLNREVFRRFKELDVQAISLSLDGATRESHDNFRGVPGCWDWTLQAAKYANEFDIPIQLNSLISGNTLHETEQMFELMKTLKIMRWSVFFLISVGRGSSLKDLSPEKAEEVMHWLCEVGKDAPFAIKTTEAPHFRRVMIQRLKESGTKQPISSLPTARGFGIRDGNGIMFISHTGDVYPSGFLPQSAGNVRKTPVYEIYRDSELFRNLRNPDALLGKCGACEFRYICGGSRARAYAATGNAMGSDPLCPYEPVHAVHETEALVA